MRVVCFVVVDVEIFVKIKNHMMIGSSALVCVCACACVGDLIVLYFAIEKRMLGV